MKNIFRALGVCALFSIALVASAGISPDPGGNSTPAAEFTFFCDPFTSPLEANGQYTFNTPTTACTYTLPQTLPIRAIGLFSGTLGNATPILVEFTFDPTSTQFTDSNTFVNPEKGDEFFVASWGATTIGEYFAGREYLETVTGAPPAELHIIPFTWAGPPTFPLTLTADSKTMVYGSALPTLTATLTGFEHGDDQASSDVQGAAQCSTTATASSPVGTYPITCTVGTLTSKEYSFENFFAGTLTITPATLTVKATDKTMTAGGSLPSLTTTFSGFVNGDTASVVSGAASCSTTATGSTVGTYPITCTQGTLSAANYTFTFTPGVLKVLYLWSGFLQPINDTAHQIGQDVSVFKGGSTVPVKLQLKDAAGNIVTNVAAPIWLAPQKGAAMSSSVDELYYTDPITTDTTFDLNGNSWQYNWGTKGLATGFWYRIYVLLPDGSIRSVTIGLR